MNPTPSPQAADAAVVPLAAGYPHAVPESPSTAEPPREDFVELRVTRQGAPTRRLQVHASRCTFGSGEGCTVRLSEPGLRSLHAILLRDAAGVRICADAIAIEVNDQPAMQSPLEPGDTFRLGPYCFELLTAPQPVAPQLTAPQSVAPQPATASPLASRRPTPGSESDVARETGSSGEPGAKREVKPALGTSPHFNSAALPPAAQRELEQTIETLQHQLAALREELESVRAEAKSQLQDSLHQCEETRQQLAQMQHRCAELQDQLQTALQQRDDAVQQRDEAVQQHESAARERDEALRERADLRASRDKALVQRSEAIDIEQAAQAQLRQVTQRLAQLQQQLDQAQQQAQGEKQQLQEAAEQQRDEAERLREQVQQQRGETERLRGEAERQRQETEQQRQEAEQQRGQLERLREEAGGLREELEQLRQQAAQWQAENERLRDLLRSERESLEAHMSRLLQQAGRRSPTEANLDAAAIAQHVTPDPVAAAPTTLAEPTAPAEPVSAKQPAVACEAASPCPAPAMTSPERAAATAVNAEPAVTSPANRAAGTRPSAGEPGQAATARVRPVVRRPPATSGFLSGPLQAAAVLLCGLVFFYCAQQNADLRIVWTTAGTLACVLALFCLYDWRRNSWMRRTSALANSASGPR